MAQTLPGRVQSVLLVHGVSMSQQASLSQQPNPPPTTAAHAHCAVASCGQVLLNGSHSQAPLMHAPVGLQHSRFVPALQTVPPRRTHRFP